jgi:hypothetical protein
MFYSTLLLVLVVVLVLVLGCFQIFSLNTDTCLPAVACKAKEGNLGFTEGNL